MRKPKPPSSEEVGRLIRKAVDEGNVGFANPKAAECMPSLDGEDADPMEQPFHYLNVFPLAPCPKRELAPHNGGLHIEWGMKGVGFGEASIVLRNGKWVANTEAMSREFLQKMLVAWTKQMRLT